MNHDGIKIVTGTIGDIKGSRNVFRLLNEKHVEDDNALLTSEDFYKIMRLRGYSYKYANFIWIAKNFFLV